MNTDIIKKEFPLANKTSHKKNNGVLSVIAGSKMIAGAAVFNLGGASVVGTGYIYGTITEDIFPVVANYCPWVVYSNKYANHNEDAVLIGSGCDNREDFDDILTEVIYNKKPIVLDAYGLKRFKDLKLQAQGTIIMTPHIGEFSYISGLSKEEIIANKVEIAKNYALENNVIMVLKDYQTVVTDGNNVYINTTGNASLAKAGSGDVLAGLIAGLLARKVDPLLAAKMGVYLHGYSAVCASKHKAISCIEPLDIIEEVKTILFECGK